MSLKWTKKEWEEFEKNRKKQGIQTNSLTSSLAALGLDEHIQLEKKKKKNNKNIKQELDIFLKERKENTNDKSTENKDNKSKIKKKRQGIDTKPIFDSLIMSPCHSLWGKDWFALNIPGGRILTYNEMFSILQYRKWEAFKYKKICRQTVSRAIAANNSKTKKPFFDGPTKLTLVREGAKEMDRDALPVVFKYFIDTLKQEGIIDDDNPNIIVDIQTIQSKGEPRLAMLLEAQPNWEFKKSPTWEELLEGKK